MSTDNVTWTILTEVKSSHCPLKGHYKDKVLCNHTDAQEECKLILCCEKNCPIAVSK